MIERRPTVGFWIPFLILPSLVYVVSFGPACWFASRLNARSGVIEAAYMPIISTWKLAPRPVLQVFQWYANIGAAERWEWRCYPRSGSYLNPDGSENPDIGWIWIDNMP